MKKVIGYGFAVVFTALLSLQSIRFDLSYSVEKGINTNIQIVEVNESVAIAYIVLISGLLGVGAVDNPGFDIKLLLQILSKNKNK